jgi:hypothetical protein
MTWYKGCIKTWIWNVTGLINKELELTKELKHKQINIAIVSEKGTKRYKRN